MTQASIKQENPEFINTSKEVLKSEIIQEIEATPQEYWSNLLQIIRSFREATTSGNNSITTEIKSEQSEQIKKNKAALELLRRWREEGDEQEQTETWEVLSKALDRKDKIEL